jgi:hypothetical protein
MSGNSAPAPPDYGPIADAMKESSRFSARLAQEQFDWAKKTYLDNKGVTDDIIEKFMASQERNDAAAIKDRARYERIYQPLEDSLAAEAKDYSSPERRATEMGRAESGVGQQFQAARVNAQRDLEAFGINPGSTRYAALDLGARTQEAATKAAAATQAGYMVDATGRALRSEAINVGRGYPGQIAGTYNTALQAGNGANNNMLSTTASGANTMGTGIQWNGQNVNALQGWGNILNQGYNNQMTAWNADNQSSGWGTALGLIGGLGMKAMTAGAFAEGGEVPEELSPTRGKAVDDVPARVSVGEFIIPKDAVDWYGQKHFYQLLEKADKDRQEMKQRTQAVPTIHPSAVGPRATPATRAAALKVN